MKKIILILGCTTFLFSCKTTDFSPAQEETAKNDDYIAIVIEKSSPTLPPEPEELVVTEELPPVAEEPLPVAESPTKKPEEKKETEAEAEEPPTEIERPILDGELIVAKKIVVEADSSSSIVVDWQGDKKAHVAKPTFSEKELIYKTDENGVSLKIKIFYNPESPKKQGIVIFVPGGDFLNCDINSFAEERKYLCENGFVVASMEYHTAQNGVYTDALNDISDAIMFLRMNFRDFNANPTKVALLGTSAGGYLASLFACMDSSMVTCVVDLYGYSDLTRMADDFDDETKAKHRAYYASEALFVNGKESRTGILENEQNAMNSNPLTYVGGDEVPFLFMHGAADKVVSPSQTVILHNALLSKGVRSVRCSLVGAGHGGESFSSESALGMIIDFLSDNFNPQKSLLQK